MTRTWKNFLITSFWLRISETIAFARSTLSCEPVMRRGFSFAISALSCQTRKKFWPPLCCSTSTKYALNTCTITTLAPVDSCKFFMVSPPFPMMRPTLCPGTIIWKYPAFPPPITWFIGIPALWQTWRLWKTSFMQLAEHGKLFKEAAKTWSKLRKISERIERQPGELQTWLTRLPAASLEWYTACLACLGYPEPFEFCNPTPSLKKERKER